MHIAEVKLLSAPEVVPKTYNAGPWVDTYCIYSSSLKMLKIYKNCSYITGFLWILLTDILIQNRQLHCKGRFFDFWIILSATLLQPAAPQVPLYRKMLGLNPGLLQRLNWQSDYNMHYFHMWSKLIHFPIICYKSTLSEFDTKITPILIHRQSRKRPVVSFGLFQVDFKNAKGQSIGLDPRLTQLNRSRGTGDWGMICTAVIAAKEQPLPAALARAAQLRATADLSCFIIAFGDSTNYHHSNHGEELGQ